jgi:hypothetical protein
MPPLQVFVVSAAFNGVPVVQRHRMVNDVVAGGAGAPLPVHALSIKASTPEQWGAGGAAAVAQTTPDCLGGSKHDKKQPQLH